MDLAVVADSLGDTIVDLAFSFMCCGMERAEAYGGLSQVQDAGKEREVISLNDETVSGSYLDESERRKKFIFR